MTKYGKFMYKLLFKCGMWLAKPKNRWLYYLLNCTWGLIMVIFGLLLSLPLWLFKKSKKYHWVRYFVVGKSWGGLEAGLLFFTDSYEYDTILSHEYGHSFQNAILGPLMPILVSIPSAIRYWIFTIREWKNKSNPAYDSIWFEKNASELGAAIVAMQTLNENQKKEGGKDEH